MADPVKTTPRHDDGRNAAAATGRVEAGVVQVFDADDFDRDVWCVFGVPIDVATVASAVEKIERSVRDRRRCAFVTPNVNMLCATLARPAARDDIADHDFSVADGAPLARLARWLGAPIAERCAGSDVFDALRARPGFRGRRIRTFFFGGRDGAAAAAHAAINAEGGGLESVGYLNPGFGDVEAMGRPEIIEAINAAEPDFVVVALGAERGNRWIVENASKLTAPAISHLGAVVDFTAGGVQRAPAPLRKTGLEWAWRIAQEPALWRRYWRDGRAFLSLLLTRAAPIAFHRPKSTGAPAAADFAAGIVRLSGDLTARDLAPVREAFRRAAASTGDVILDVARAGAMDAAFLGQILMLEKALRRRGADLTIAGAGPRALRYLTLNGLRFKTIANAATDGSTAGVAAAA